MKHPLLGKTFLFYSLAWVAIMVAHVNILYLQFDFPFDFSLTDSLIFNGMLLGYGILLWYIVKYISPANQGITGTILNQGLAIIVGVTIIAFGSDRILSSLIGDDDEIAQFLGMAIPWRIFLGSFFLGMLVLVYYLLQYTSSLKQKEKEEAELQHLLKQAELDTLKFQLNPHFIFNSLNSISSLTLMDNERAHEMVIKLSEFLRGSLGREDKELHSLEDELDQMKRYLDIERVRFGNRLELEEDIDENCFSQKVPNLILQPIYENAIKYGIYEQLGKVLIKTKVFCDGDKLNILVSNNYDSESIPQKGKGIGLKNISNRLDLIYGKSDLVTIKKGKDIFNIELIIPQNLIND